MLRCSYEGCESRTDPNGYEPFFDISVTVDKDRGLAENLSTYNIEAAFFTCCYCGSKAEENDRTLDEMANGD